MSIMVWAMQGRAMVIRQVPEQADLRGRICLLHARPARKLT
jgi:hypothetical protein